MPLLVTVAMLVLSAFLLFKAVPGFAFIKFRMVSTAMQLPMQVVYFSQVLLFSFLCISLIFRIIQMLYNWKDRSDEAPEWEKEVEEVKGEVN